MSQQTPHQPNHDSRTVFERRLIRLFVAAQEVDAGVRPAEHLTRWLADDVLMKIRVRAELAQQRHRLRRGRPARPDVHVLRTLVRPTYDLTRIDCVVVFTKDGARTQVATVVFGRSRDRWLVEEYAVL
ncbi:Rv3235 family protein [Pseudoclavibacter sp. 13-3]|uniref:Rv3235 family protein n=1 Tax=Pseudoclavibacter sp. 13-3 TaxID=2901228 RepID=UPI001E36F1D0|nr:Rv3235 family protein [Pseudoclavibacter sp. 13-3]MCD7102353.1 Rv3235 family protein [Pseudoclavibacter sp. 13-3]